MGSDSLEKPSQQRNFTGNLRLFWDKASVYFQRFQPRSGRPWILFPDLAIGLISLIWTLVLGLSSLVWTYFFPSSLKKYLRLVNWARFGFQVFSRVLLVCYAWIAIALWYGSPWGPGGQWPLLSVKELPHVMSNMKKWVLDPALFP